MLTIFVFLLATTMCRSQRDGKEARIHAREQECRRYMRMEPAPTPLLASWQPLSMTKSCSWCSSLHCVSKSSPSALQKP